MRKPVLLALFLLLIANTGKTQAVPFDVVIEPMNIANLGGIQAFAWGQSDGKWLIIGGRLDGLHRRQPFAAFDIAGHNNQLIVVDPVAQQQWTAPLSSLSTGLQEQLSATNMEFYQDGEYLYLIGGYGYSATVDDHITYPNLSAVNVPNVINSIVAGTSITADFRQITDTMFAVTGGYLNKIYDTYHLTGGQKFIGRYNPMGPNNGPGFIQVYTNADRKFKLVDNGTTLTVTHLPATYDAANLHRRDYNVIPQIMPNGEEGITAFSGVFQATVDLPFLNCVNIDSNGAVVNNAFAQYYNHYHCAHIPLYSEAANEMHNLFFGGIAQYYDSMGILVQDNNVPFVNTIARVTRDASGTMSEYKLPIEMPALLGSASEFIPLASVPHFNNEVLKLDDITNDTTLVGYIYGGISSTAANIFFTNTGTESSASSAIFKVYIVKNPEAGIHELNAQSTGSLQMRVYPNPNDGNFNVSFNLASTEGVYLKIIEAGGREIESTLLKNAKVGENNYSKKVRKLQDGGIYYVTIETPYEKVTQKIVVEP